MKTAAAICVCILATSFHAQSSCARDPAETRLDQMIERFESETRRLHKSIEAAFLGAKQKAVGDRENSSIIQRQYREFQSHRKLPPWLNDRVRTNYQSQLAKNCANLITTSEKEIKAARRRGNEVAARLLERRLGDFLINARGHGLALPAVGQLQGMKFRLRNASSAFVMDVDTIDNVEMRAESRSRPTQVFEFLVFEDSVAIRNVKSQKCLNIPLEVDDPGTQMIVWSDDGSHPNEKWIVREEGRLVVLVSNLNGLVLGTELGEGELNHRVVQQAEADKLSQRWSIEAAVR